MLYAQKVEISGNNAEGYIESAGYKEGEKGFIIRWNGNAEFNNVTVRGHIEANSGFFTGTLRAGEILVTGTVNSGTAHLLRGNSVPVEVRAEAGWISAGYEGLLKEIRTLAKGTCLLRLTFPKVAPARIGDINRGNIRITINDVNLSGYEWYFIDTSSGSITLNIPNIPLNQNINTVRLYGTPYVGGNALPPQSVINTIFELRCAQDPAFLGALG